MRSVLVGFFVGMVALMIGLVSAFAWTEKQVASADLHGTLMLPDGEGPVPAVLMLAGSGPVDRDGNLPGFTNNSLILLAQGLAARGIASLRIDKRGIAASRAAGPNEADLRFDDYVRDAVAWLAVLRAEPRAGKLFLLGHSEGALVATLAAQRVDVAGLVLLAGAGEPAGDAVARQLADGHAPAAVQEASKRIAARLAAGEMVQDVPLQLAPLYRPSVQAYVASWFALDPVRELGRTTCPVLIVQGTTDLQVGVTDAHKLQAARADAKLVLIEGMNHVLKDAPAERTANLQTYGAPALPLAAALVPAIADFIGR